MNLNRLFYVGGTMGIKVPSYVDRPADDEIFNRILAGQYCYVLTARQMGKSSLMVKTVFRLKEKQVKPIIIDLTLIGTVKIDAWYLGLLTRIRKDLELSVDVQAWWNKHQNLGVPQRFSEFFSEVVLQSIDGQIAVFIDEIDQTLDLQFRDDFFAVIRAMYNARAVEPIFERLSFILLGVATPIDLIQNPKRTPFNIGHSVGLQGFDRHDAQPLQKCLEQVCPDSSGMILDRIFYWTNGHPYLTQKLCSEVVNTPCSTWDAKHIDELVNKLFFAGDLRGANNLQFITHSIRNNKKRRSLVKLYQKVYSGKQITNDTRSPLQNRLKLIGLVRAENNYLCVNNEIYRGVFDQQWIKKYKRIFTRRSI